MARWSLKKAQEDGTSGRIECVFCGLRYTEAATLHRHIRQSHRDKK